MTRQMPFEELELVYESLAQAIDSAGQDNEALLLTKLVILLARRGDLAEFSAALEIAGRDLPEART